MDRARDNGLFGCPDDTRDSSQRPHLVGVSGTLESMAKDKTKMQTERCPILITKKNAALPREGSAPQLQHRSRSNAAALPRHFQRIP